MSEGTQPSGGAAALPLAEHVPLKQGALVMPALVVAWCEPYPRVNQAVMDRVAAHLPLAFTHARQRV